VPRSKNADNPVYDRLTDNGRAQAASAAARLQRASLTAAISAPEIRTRDTALAITLRAGLPTASVDGALTSKAFDGESPSARGERGIAATRRFLAATHGAVVIVSHGHIINNMVTILTGGALTADVVKSELVNGGIVKMAVTRDASGAERWTKLESDALMRDE
jgi:broad specificity phosphatase PhoE